MIMGIPVVVCGCCVDEHIRAFFYMGVLLCVVIVVLSRQGIDGH